MSGEPVSLTSGERIGRGVMLFFDPSAIAARIDRPVRRAHSLTGYHVRQVARRRLRHRRRSSRAGESPSSHGAERLRSAILFARDPSGSILIGPEFRSIASATDRPVRGTIPQTIERGGDVALVEQLRRVRGQGLLWRIVPRHRAVNPALPTRRRVITIQARPFMRPALESSSVRIGELFEDIL